MYLIDYFSLSNFASCIHMYTGCQLICRKFRIPWSIGPPNKKIINYLKDNRVDRRVYHQKPIYRHKIDTQCDNVDLNRCNISYSHFLHDYKNMNTAFLVRRKSHFLQDNKINSGLHRLLYGRRKREANIPTKQKRDFIK